MIERHYSCILLSDIIISAHTSTQGHSLSLDYIPGSNFMGIAAGSYQRFGCESAYEIFHSGKVRFGDAHIAVDGKRSLKMPCSWYHPKGADKLDEIYIHHSLSDQKRQEMRQAGDQLKQIRSGFFIQENGHYIQIPTDHNFSIKSAYDMDKRKSKEAQMFGYDSLKQGSQWIFTITGPTHETLEKIHASIIGVQHIGRSKTAQYGKVKIQELPSFSKNITMAQPIGNQMILYFESPAAFMDSSANFTLQPDISDLGLTSGRIDWAATQIRYRTFAPWNGKRKARDQDRIFIDKGSVIVVKDLEMDFDINSFAQRIRQGIGFFKTEGFGILLINPGFLSVKEDAVITVSDREILQATIAIKDQDKSDDTIIQWLSQKKQDMKNHYQLMDHVSKFSKEFASVFGRISPSQWGAVRERALREPDDDRLFNDLFTPGTGFLCHGKSEKKWRTPAKILQEKTKDIHHALPEGFARLFLIKISTEMPKKRGAE